MSYDAWVKVITLLSPVLTAVFGVGGFAAWWEYKSRKPKGDADAAAVIQGTEITVAQAWQNYAQQVDQRFSKIQIQYDELYGKFEDMRKSLQEKDDEVAVLKRRISELETELAKYRSVGPRAEDARNTLHKTVDKKINEIKDSEGLDGTS